MTRATRSSSSSFRKQDTAGDLAPPPFLSSSSLNVPKDIQELLYDYVGWDTFVDLCTAARKYSCMLREQIYPKNFNIIQELEKLKGLSYALGSKHDIYKKNCERFATEFENYYQSLVEELVEQVPGIKDMPGYGHLTTGTEKFLIHQALQKKVPEVKPRVGQDADLAMHLEDLRKRMRPMEEKMAQMRQMSGRIMFLCLDVDNFILTLKDIITQSGFGYVLDSEAMVGGDMKRRKLESPIKDSKKLPDRKEVEDALLKVLVKVSGKSAVDTESRKKWDSIVDNFTSLLKAYPRM